MATKNAKTAKTRPEKACKPNTESTHCKSCLPCADKCGQKPEPEPEPEPVSGHGPELSIGEALARKGISAMAKSKECKDRAEEQNVKDFLRACSDSGNDPVAVVKQVAETYKIDLYADGRFDDTIQRDVRSLLMKVLTRFVVDATSFAVSEIAGCDWKTILKEYINQRLGGVFKRECRGDGSDDKAYGPGYGEFSTNDLVPRTFYVCPVGYSRVVPVIRI